MVAVKRSFWPVEPVGFIGDRREGRFSHPRRFELLLVVPGSIRLYAQPGVERQLSAGEIAIVHGWQPHATQALGAQNCVLAVQFDPSVARHDPHFSRRRFELPEEGEVPERPRALAASIFVETRMKRAAWQMGGGAAPPDDDASGAGAAAPAGAGRRGNRHSL